MKKQFNKVKQFADNAISRVDKLDADVVSEDLLEDERRVECIRAMCATTRRRITHLLPTTAAGRKPPSSSSASSSSVSDRPSSALFSATTIINAATNPSSAMAAAGAGSLSFDEHHKLMKKSPDHQLGVCFKASSEALGVDSVIGRILASCAQVQMRLADQRLSLEQLVDSQVMQNSVLHQLLLQQIPDVNKQRKTLTRLSHEVDSLRNKLASSSSGSAGSGNQHQMHRMDSVRSDLAIAEQKLQECKDRWVGDMYHVLSRETELSQLFVQLMRLQLHYHRSSLELLELSVPQLEQFVESANAKPVYGLSLEEHLRVSGRRIALPLQLCVCRLLQLGVDQEGLFRMAGSTTRVRKLKQCLNASRQLAPHLLDECCSDVHVLADAIKSYLRSLPDPLMCLAMHDQWLSVAAIKDTGQKLQLMKQLLHQLPPAHYDNLCYLIKFLAHLCKDQTVTRMSPSNLAIVMAPNLLWLDETAAAAAGGQFDMRTLAVLTWLVEMLIVHCDTLFTQDVSFFDGYDEIVGAGCAVTADSLNVGSRLSLISGASSSRHNLRSPSTAAAAAAAASFDMSDTSCHSASSSAGGGGGGGSSCVSSPPATPMMSLSRSERHCPDRRSMLGSAESLLSTDSQQQQQQYSAVGNDSPYNTSTIRRARRKKNFAPIPPTEPVETCSAPSPCPLPPSAAPSCSSKPVSPPARAQSFRRPMRPSVPPPLPMLKPFKTIHQQQPAAAAAAVPLLLPPPPPPTAAARTSTAAAAAAVAKTAAEKIVQSRDCHNETTLSDQPDRMTSLVTGGVTATATTATATAFPVVHTDSATAETAGAELASASSSTISTAAGGASVSGAATATAAGGGGAGTATAGGGGGAGTAAGAAAVSHLPLRPVIPPRPASSIRDSAAVPASPPVLRTSAFDRSKPPAVRLSAQISDQTAAQAAAAAAAAALQGDWVAFAE